MSQYRAYSFEHIRYIIPITSTCKAGKYLDSNLVAKTKLKKMPLIFKNPNLHCITNFNLLSLQVKRLKICMLFTISQNFQFVFICLDSYNCTLLWKLLEICLVFIFLKYPSQNHCILSWSRHCTYKLYSPNVQNLTPKCYCEYSLF